MMPAAVLPPPLRQSAWGRLIPRRQLQRGGTPCPAEPVRSSVRCDVHARARARCLPYRLHHAVRSCVCLVPLRRLAPPCVSPSPPPPRCVPATEVQAVCKHALSASEARRAVQTAHRCQWLMKASSLQREAKGSAGGRGDRAESDRRGKGAAVWGARVGGTDGWGRHCKRSVRGTWRAQRCADSTEGGAGERAAGRVGEEGAGRVRGMSVEPRRRDVETVPPTSPASAPLWPPEL